MKENIKHYPINYCMSVSLKGFFTCITESKELQVILYNSNTLVEVSDIAKEMGFDVSPAEVLQSQAGRVLSIINEKLVDDINILVAGGKPKTGAQWGRGGNGYLDRAGYWLVGLRAASAEHPENKQVDAMFTCIFDNSQLEDQVRLANTITDIVSVLGEHSIPMDATDLLAYQASVILGLDEQTAFQVAS